MSVVIQGQFSLLTVLNSEFSFSLAICHTMVKEPSLPHYLPIPIAEYLDAFISQGY